MEFLIQLAFFRIFSFLYMRSKFLPWQLGHLVFLLNTSKQSEIITHCLKLLRKQTGIVLRRCSLSGHKIGKSNLGAITLIHFYIILDTEDCAISNL